MAKNYDELTDYAQGSDSGQNQVDSIQPVGGGEFLSDPVLDRPSENNRKRTERIRSKLEELAYFADYDRALLFRSDLGFEFQQVSSGGTAYRLNGFGSGDLWIYPSLTPGRLSGGRLKGGRVFSTNGGNWLPYAGTPLVNDLILTCNSDFVGQRGYADGDTFDAPSTALTLGANGVKVQLVANAGLAGGIGSLSAVWSGAPKRKVVITYGSAAPATQLADVINFINSDLTSGGTYGLANFFRATTTGSLTNPPPTFNDGQVQGQYDAEAFQITLAQLTAFFDIVANQLAEGESLALGFPAGPVEIGAGLKGGRRQSLWDLPTNRLGGKTQNTTPAVSTNLFNTAREPEKIPGSIPVGKMIQGRFVFADGTVLLAKTFGVGTPGDSAIKLSESADTIARYTSSISHSNSGAFFIGYAASPGVQWANTDPFAPTNVADAIDQIVTDLSSITALHSGADRIGGDAMAGTASVGNIAKSVSSGTLGAQILDMLNGAGGASASGGINARLSEFGHALHGRTPLSKNFGETSPVDISGGGAQLLRALIPAQGTESSEAGSAVHDVEVLLEPLVLKVSGNPAIIVNNPIEAGTQPGTVHLTGLGVSAIGAYRRIPGTTEAFDASLDFFIMVEIKGLTGVSPDGNGLYYFLVVDPTNSDDVILIKPFGGVPDFTGADFTAATLTFYKTTIVGRSQAGAQLRAFLVQNPDEPAAKILFPGRDESLAVVNYDLVRIYRGGRGYGFATLPVEMARIGSGGFNFIERNPANDVITAERKSQNVLVAGDKVLLDGVETTTPVDATAGHHHGGAYTRTHYVPTSSINPQVIDWTTLSTTPTSPTQINTGLTTAFIPVGYKKIGVIFNAYLEFIPSVVGLTSIHIPFGFVDGSPAAFVEYGVIGDLFHASGSTSHSISRMLFLPVEEIAGPNFSIYAYRASSNVNIAGNLTLTEIATVIERI